MLKFYQDLSLKWKVPIRTALLVLVSTTIVTIALLLSMRKEVQKDFTVYAESAASALTSSLVTSILHQDTWRAFEVIRAYQKPSNTNLNSGFLKPMRITLLDTENKVFVSTDPRALPITSELVAQNSQYQSLQKQATFQEAIAWSKTGDVMMLYSQVNHNGLVLGGVLVEYDTTPLAERLQEMLVRALFIVILLIGLIILISWQWGKRFAEPLINLAHCMEKLGQLPNDLPNCPLPQGNDEIGRLGKQFQKMSVEMAQKFKLEQQLLHGERMSALGRMISGIAHEVNNPLGGMLNTINTQKKRGINDTTTEKTLNLLERGLNQIRNTVSALLVEAKIENRTLSPQDVDDVLILCSAQANEKHIKFHIEKELPESIDLPANPVRQLLLNLLLNAVQASFENGQIFCRIYFAENKLKIRIVNSGKTIDASKLATLFEPNFGFESNQRRGFGLWIIYQLVTQLNGDISVKSDIMTEFNVALPIIGEKND